MVPGEGSTEQQDEALGYQPAGVRAGPGRSQGGGDVDSGAGGKIPNLRAADVGRSIRVFVTQQWRIFLCDAMAGENAFSGANDSSPTSGSGSVHHGHHEGHP